MNKAANVLDASSVRLELLPIEKLQPHPDNPRVVMREDVIESIQRQIEQSGFSPAHSVQVRPHDDAFQIISGHHRAEAARRAGLQAVPCFVQDMTDEQAFMALVLANAQGELSPLEIGIHVLRYVKTAKGGQSGGEGLKGGLREYARRISGDEDASASRYSQLRASAEVFVHVSTVQSIEQYPHEQLINKSTHLTAIHAAPQEAWPALVEELIDAAATVNQISDKAKRVATVVKEIPDWWRPKIDIAALAKQVIANPKAAESRKKAFVAGAKAADGFGLVTLYRHEDTEERVERNGREYIVQRATPYEFDAKAAFVDAVLKGDVAPKVDRINAIAADIKRKLNSESNDGDRHVPVLTDEEHAERVRQAELEAEEETRQEIARQIFHGDCREALASWQSDQKIRLLMTDPPYGMDFQSNRRVVSDKADAIKGDATAAEAAELLDEVLAAAAPHMGEDSHLVVFCHDHSLGYLRSTIEAAGFTVRGVLVWVKPNHTSGDLFGAFARRKEFAIHATLGDPDVNPRRDDVYVQDHFSRETDHPTEKPVDVLTHWMGCLVDVGDLVVDPFAGTGATLVAAARLKCQIWGAEMDETYRDAAIERLWDEYGVEQNKDNAA